MEMVSGDMVARRGCRGGSAVSGGTLGALNPLRISGVGNRFLMRSAGVAPRCTHQRADHRSVMPGGLRRVAARPAPFVIELRDVVAIGFGPSRPTRASPLASVRVESVVAADGARVARVNVGLSTSRGGRG